MQVWLGKIHSRGEGPEVLFFRADLEEKILSLPPEWRVSADFTLEQVDIAFLVFADGFTEAIDRASDMVKFLGVPQSQAALGVIYFGELPTLGPPAID